MRLADLVGLVFANLLRMVGRVIFTALGVVIGTASIVILISLAAGLQQSANQSFEGFGAANHITVFSGGFFGGAGDTGDLAILDREALLGFRQIDGVVAVTPRQGYPGSTQLSLNRLEGGASITGVDPLALDDLGFTAEQGVLNLSRSTIVVGARVGENFFNPRAPGPPGDPVDLFGQTIILEQQRTSNDGEVQTRTVRLRVGAVLEEIGGQDDFTIFMSINEMEDLSAWLLGQQPRWAQNGYGQVTVVAENDPQTVLDVEQQIIEMGYGAFSASSQLQSLNILFLVIQAILGGIGGIALLVAAIGISNTMVMSVLERTREIGLMKAVGARNRDVISVFMIEAGLIGMLGGIVGVVVGVVGSLIINAIGTSLIIQQTVSQGGTPPENLSITAVPVWLPIFAVIFALIIGLVAGIIPAFRAVQLDPVRALKYE